MDERLVDFISRIRDKESWPDRWRATIALLRSFGAVHVAVAAESPGQWIEIESTLPESLLTFYTEVAYPAGDPRLEYCRSEVNPCFAGKEYDHLWDNPPAMQQFDEELALAGVRSAALFPVHGQPNGVKGCVCFYTNLDHERHAALVRRVDSVIMLAAQIGFNYWQQGRSIVRRGLDLTSREIECLVWLARGLRNDRIAEKLGLTIATVNFHLTNARIKLNAKTRTEAVACALQMNLICP